VLRARSAAAEFSEVTGMGKILGKGEKNAGNA